MFDVKIYSRETLKEVDTKRGVRSIVVTNNGTVKLISSNGHIIAEWPHKHITMIVD